MIHLSVLIKANLDFDCNILSQSVFEELNIQDSDEGNNILPDVL